MKDELEFLELQTKSFLSLHVSLTGEEEVTEEVQGPLPAYGIPCVLPHSWGSCSPRCPFTSQLLPPLPCAGIPNP